jgi:hypothetical protein
MRLCLSPIETQLELSLIANAFFSSRVAFGQMLKSL